MRALAILIAGIIALGLMLWGVSHLRPSETVAPDVLTLTPVAWPELKGWAQSDPVPALQAFQRSCARILALPGDRAMGGTGAYGTAQDWRAGCEQLPNALPSAEGARAFFESEFQPMAAGAGSSHTGLFTGYYEPELLGNPTYTDEYGTPLLRRPAELVMVNLGDFREELKGQRIAGRVVEGQLMPYATRAEIEAESYDKSALALLYVKDPVDAFFLQIQGSGRVRLPDGSIVRVGYDGQNGHPYTPIGRVLREMGELDPGAISMQTIRDWLERHPARAAEVMNTNASYVFFREVAVEDPDLGPPGAEGVPLTPGRSLAVDRSFHALGVPMWLDSTLPLDDGGTPGPAFRRLMIAQDTGGAIRGPVRGDVFFGFGGEATLLAGRMKQEGQLYVLLPTALAARLGE